MRKPIHKLREMPCMNVIIQFNYGKIFPYFGEIGGLDHVREIESVNP